MSGSTVTIVGREGPGSRLDPNRLRVWPGFHEVMGIPLLAGRSFTEADLAQPNGVTLISQAFARRYWPNRSPLGEALRYGREGETQTIVGVVGDIRAETLHAEARPTFYVLLGRYTPATMSLLARGQGDPEATAASMRRAIQEMNPSIPVAEEGDVASLVAWSAREEEYRTLLMAVFASLATLLAGVGIFGVTARGVTHRAREMGIRMAVGAEHTGLVNDTMQGAVGAGIPGILVGLAGAFLVSQLLAGALFGVSVADPLTYGVVTALAMGLCALASYLSARRIARIDPARVLKEE
jgi:putative ABC transport system permease protein